MSGQVVYVTGITSEGPLGELRDGDALPEGTVVTDLKVNCDGVAIPLAVPAPLTKKFFEMKMAATGEPRWRDDPSYDWGRRK